MYSNAIQSKQVVFLVFTGMYFWFLFRREFNDEVDDDLSVDDADAEPEPLEIGS